MAVRTQEILKAIGDEGVTPLEYMLGVLRDPGQPHSERFRAAIEAAPFMHPRLAAVQHSGDPDSPINHEHRIRRIELVAKTFNGRHDDSPDTVTA